MENPTINYKTGEVLKHYKNISKYKIVTKDFQQ